MAVEVDGQKYSFLRGSDPDSRHNAFLGGGGDFSPLLFKITQSILVGCLLAMAC